ncbi:hypothetical protein SORBI_3007G191500 [Sorghum bicolor]|uniref:Uncharacterized protein n=1 Tax=Sorghum bicolor TaxID=4558 RepID=A0A1Z5RAN4_SORBI|nr:hypothetical protein SORBI_3007G191500 [Sorghum bicolor]
MATALTLKMAAVCMLVLTMGQLMAAVGASAPLVQADAAAPTARRLLSAEDHERRPASDDDPESDKAMEAMMLLRLLQKTKGAAAPAPTFLQKTGGSCPCISPLVNPWCCFGSAGSAATN